MKPTDDLERIKVVARAVEGARKSVAGFREALKAAKDQLAFREKELRQMLRDLEPTPLEQYGEGKGDE